MSKATELADGIEKAIRPEASLPLGHWARAAAELRRLDSVNKSLLEALKWIADHDLHGADLTVCGHMAHGFIGKARAAIKQAEGNRD